MPLPDYKVGERCPHCGYPVPRHHSGCKEYGDEDSYEASVKAERDSALKRGRRR